MSSSRSGRGFPICSIRSASIAAPRQARLWPVLPQPRQWRTRRCHAEPAVLDAENGYVLAPMEQGIRLTTGVEFAARDAEPTPVQFDRLMPAARDLFALGEPVEARPWLGARPCFADSRPVIGLAPGQNGLWLACGHGQWGLTLGAVTGRLLADDHRGDAVLDPTPYSAKRFMPVIHPGARESANPKSIITTIADFLRRSAHHWAGAIDSGFGLWPPRNDAPR